MAKTHEGFCRICGNFGPLSFEHIPPRAAFNNRPVMVANLDVAMKLGPDEIAKGPIQQRGMGAYTLCYRCNNDTGGWYGKRFVDWCYQGMHILQMAQGKPSLIYINYLFPLSILKQIITMFFTVNGVQFRKANPELVEFVLNKEKMYLSPKYRVFVYYNIEGRFRTVGGAAITNLNKGGKPISLSEISFPPFGYMITFGSNPPDDRLFEIKHFARYDYSEWTPMELKLPVLPTHLAIPGDYRTKDEIDKQYQENMEQEKRMQANIRPSKR